MSTLHRSLRSASRVTVLAALAMISVSESAAQAAGAIRELGPLISEFPEPFSSISELAQFPDERLLVVDFLERRVLLVDLDAGTVMDAAREGGGPLEFRSSSPIVPLADGRVLLWDVVQDRILVFEATGRPSGTRPARVQHQYAVLPRVADASGALYGELRGWKRENGGLVQADSSAIVRLRGNSADTLSLVRAEFESHRTSRDRNVLRPSGFRAFDAWGVFNDGSVLVVRGAEYVPQIVSADGGVREFDPIEFTRIPVTREDRERQMQTVRKSLEDARRRRVGAGASSLGELRVAEPLAWAQYKPAVSESYIRVDSRNRAWVSVHDRDNDSGQRYDLLSSGGRRLDSVRVPVGERLVGFGRGVLFTARKEESGLEYLRRYSLP